MTNGISTWRPDQRGKNLFFVQKPFIGKPFMRCLNILWLNDELINWISITVERESVWKRGPPLCDSRATAGLLSPSPVSIWKHGIYAFIDSNQNSTAALNRHDIGWRISVNHTDGWRWQRGLGQSMCWMCATCDDADIWHYSFNLMYEMIKWCWNGEWVRVWALHRCHHQPLDVCMHENPSIFYDENAIYTITCRRRRRAHSLNVS